LISVGAAVAFVVSAVATGILLAPGGRAPNGINAVRFGGIPIVGALFAGRTSQPHFCTAGVVSSPARDLLVTAAHCVSGSGEGLEFVPDYRAGQTPYGLWKVTAAYAAPGWLARQDPREDVAFLIVADHRVARRTIGIQDVTGGARLGTPPTAGQPVTVIAYPQGKDDLPIRCRSSVYFDDGYPAFDCGGYVNGTSGAPWLTNGPPGVTKVVAVSGGDNQGGCEAGTSYAAPFTAIVGQLYQQAIFGSPPSLFPTPRPSGC
jgi:V8-like Glu-specific endopeptidase